MSDFFAMGGYGAYLWPCYALTAAVTIANVVLARRSLRRAQQQARRRLESAS